MDIKKSDHCRSPQRADTVSGVELVVGMLPISAVPDRAREEAIQNVLSDESHAKRIAEKNVRDKASLHQSV